MTLFRGEEERRPRMYAVLPGTDYAAALAGGLHARLGEAGPLAAAQVSVLVNTARASRAIEAALADHALASAGGALLPRVSLVTSLWEDPLALPDRPPAIDRLRRRLRLTRLVEHFLAAAPGRAPVSAAPELAESLARLIDELDEWGVAPGRLDGLVEGEVARHWQEALAFADIVRLHWPEIRAEAEGGAEDPAARARAAIGALVAGWETAPPKDPLIVAGSTGSRAPTAALMAAIARLPQGAVVLPGFDPGVDPSVWEAVGPDHPFGPFRALLDRLGMRPADVRPWMPETPAPRLRLLAQAMRPALVTDAWVAARGTLAAEAPAAAEGLSLIEAETPTAEAAAIALVIRREIAAPGRRVALVTRDATLARRVTAELARFGIEPDDSLGRPLADSAAGVFLRLIAEVAGGRPDPVRLAALLNHPLTAPGIARGAHLALARAYEIAVLRRVPDPTLPPGRLAPWPLQPVEPSDWRAAPEGMTDWLAAIEGALAPLAGALAKGAGLGETVALHRAAAEALSRGEGSEPRAWSGQDGEAAARLLDRLGRAADAYGDGGAVRYAMLLETLMRDETLRPDAARPHPRAVIWGTREARVEAADLMILGGLNEGSWPPAPAPDPWLSRPMRAALGLPSPERQVGLSAHDFLQAAARPRAVLTRAGKAEGAPTVPSRWLVRLENLLGGVAPAALEGMRARGREILELLALIHRPAPGSELPPAARPRPCPPVAARPRRLSVTRIETLIRDAYAVYAERVLRLSALDPLGKAPDALDRGNAVHAILHRFVAEAPAAESPKAARVRLMALAEAEIATRIPWPETRRAWLARIARAADWFVEGEAARRARGEPVALERPGSITLDLPAGAFVLSARADRIDRVDGGGFIYDYKAGNPPTAKQIGVFAQQLHLQGLILSEGGFEGLPSMAVAGGAYLGITGSGAGGIERSPAKDAPPIAEAIPEHRERLIRLLSSYDSEATPYVSRGFAEREGREGDYDHLARCGEWEAAETGEAPGAARSHDRGEERR